MVNKFLSVFVLFSVTLASVSALAGRVGSPDEPPGNTECKVGYKNMRLPPNPCKMACEKAYSADVCNRMGITNRKTRHVACNKKGEDWWVQCREETVGRYWAYSTRYDEGMWFKNYCQDYVISLMPCDGTNASRCSKKCACLNSWANTSGYNPYDPEHRARKAECRRQCTQCSQQSQQQAEQNTQVASIGSQQSQPQSEQNTQVASIGSQQSQPQSKKNVQDKKNVLTVPSSATGQR